MSSSRHVRPPHDKSKVQLLCYLHTVTILVPLVSYFLENAMVGFFFFYDISLFPQTYHRHPISYIVSFLPQITLVDGDDGGDSDGVCVCVGA